MKDRERAFTARSISGKSKAIAVDRGLLIPEPMRRSSALASLAGLLLSSFCGAASAQLAPTTAGPGTAPATALPSTPPIVYTTPPASTTTVPAGSTIVTQTPNVIVVETPPADTTPASTAPSKVVFVEPPKAERPAPEHTVWYGGETLLLDGATTALFVGSGVTIGQGKGNVGGVLALGGLTTYLFGPPIVHFAHGRIGPGFASFGLRLVLPIETAFDGFLLGGLASSRDRDGYADATGPAVGAAIGLVAGMALSSAIDAALLAKFKSRDVDPEAFDPDTDHAANEAQRKEARAHAKPYEVQWSPTAGPVQGGATVGVVGAF